jgi:hypothetical protein
MVSSRAWFALAVAGVLGLFYVGHGLHSGQDAAWQLPAGNVATAQEAGKDDRLRFRPTNQSSSDEEKKIAKIPGGWLVMIRVRNRLGEDAGVGLTFVPDPEHKWDGNSLK